MSTNKEQEVHFDLKVIFTLLSIIILIHLNTLIVFAEDNDTETLSNQELLRQQEIKASNTIAIIILLLIIIPIFIYFGSEKIINRKHLKRARKIAPKTKKIIEAHKKKEKEEDTINKQKALNELNIRRHNFQKINVQRKYLQNIVEKKRNHIKEEKKNIIISEFEDQEKEGFLEPKLPSSKNKQNTKKRNIFLSLNDLSQKFDNKTDENTKKDDVEKEKKNNDSIFDKLDKLE